MASCLGSIIVFETDIKPYPWSITISVLSGQKDIFHVRTHMPSHPHEVDVRFTLKGASSVLSLVRTQCVATKSCNPQMKLDINDKLHSLLKFNRSQANLALAEKELEEFISHVRHGLNVLSGLTRDG